MLLAAIWGCSFWWIKVGLRATSFIDVAFGRLVFGAAALLTVSGLTHTRLPRGRATWLHLFVLGILLNSVPFTLFAYGETHISAVLAGLINALTPVATIIATVAVFRDQRPTRTMVAGMVVGLAGVLIVIGVWNGLGQGQLLGVAACVGAVACYGLSFPYSRRYVVGRGEGPVGLATGQVICGTVQLLPFALLTGRIHSHVAWTSVLALVALGVLGSGLAYVLNFYVVSSATAAVASTVTYIVPIFAVIAGVAFLNEAVAWYEPVGGLVVLLGAAISQDRLRSRTLRSAVDSASPRLAGLPSISQFAEEEELR